MKKIYLVKKDVHKPSGEGNWITMTPYEFAQFMKTPEGHKRRKCFAQLDGCEHDDYIIVAESEEILAREIRCEKKQRDYQNSIKKEMGYTVFSYNEQENSEEDLSGEELLEDESVNVSEEAIKNLMIQKMRLGLSILSKKELQLINEVYLSNTPISTNQYASKYGINPSTAYARLESALDKLNFFLKNQN